MRRCPFERCDKHPWQAMRSFKLGDWAACWLKAIVFRAFDMLTSLLTVFTWSTPRRQKIGWDSLPPNWLYSHTLADPHCPYQGRHSEHPKLLPDHHPNWFGSVGRDVQVLSRVTTTAHKHATRAWFSSWLMGDSVAQDKINITIERGKHQVAHQIWCSTANMSPHFLCMIANVLMSIGGRTMLIMGSVIWDVVAIAGIRTDLR